MHAAPAHASPPAGALCFGPYELHPAQRRLLAHGEPLALGARAFDVLLALAERPGELIGKDALLERVWPGVVVEENNLQVHVSALRKLLGAQAIATIPGRGYRFTLEPTQRAPAARPAPASLPERLPPLLGREADLVALRTLGEVHALLTVVGPGGIGKTRLAQALAQERAAVAPQSVVWVELAPLSDAALLPGALAAAIGLELAASGPPLAALLSALKPLAVWIVLDNAEHLLEGVAALAQALLRGTAGVRLLVTSQAPLRIEGEALYRLDALAVPAPGATAEQALQHGAVALLAERAGALDRRFTVDAANVEAVVDICRRLDGMPLALQLAAARLPMLGAAALARGLAKRFTLLQSGARGAAERHATLRATFDWSYALLGPVERRNFCRLGVFVGGFTLELARAALCDDSSDSWAVIDSLAVLVERSLVSADGRDPPRYALSETGRAYALARWSDPDHAEAAASLPARHAQALREVFEHAPTAYLGEPDALWLARFEPELDNLRAALAWALVHDGVCAVALVGAAAPLWRYLSLDAETQRAVQASEAHVASAPSALAARWWRAAQWAWAEEAPTRSRAAGAAAQALYRGLGDTLGLYAELTAIAGQWQVAHSEADAALAEALAIESPHWPARARAWGFRARADVARAHGRLAESREARERELALRCESGDERGRLRALSHLADLWLALGDAKEAVRLGRELVLQLHTRRTQSTLCVAQLNLVNALLRLGSCDEARALAREASGPARDFGLLWLAGDDLALIAARQQRFEIAASLLGWADAAYAARADSRTASRAHSRCEVSALVNQALEAGSVARLMHAGSEGWVPGWVEAALAQGS